MFTTGDQVIVLGLTAVELNGSPGVVHGFASGNPGVIRYEVELQPCDGHAEVQRKAIRPVNLARRILNGQLVFFARGELWLTGRVQSYSQTANVWNYVVQEVAGSVSLQPHSSLWLVPPPSSATACVTSTSVVTRLDGSGLELTSELPVASRSFLAWRLLQPSQCKYCAEDHADLEFTFENIVSGNGHDRKDSLEHKHVRIRLSQGDKALMQVATEMPEIENECSRDMTPVQHLSFGNGHCVCVAHLALPMSCFCTGEPSQPHPVLSHPWPKPEAVVSEIYEWSSAEEYVRNWKPLCWMESVTAALQAGTRRLRIDRVNIKWIVPAMQAAHLVIIGEFHVSSDILSRLVKSVEVQVVMLLCVSYKYMDPQLGSEVFWTGHGIVNDVIVPSVEDEVPSGKWTLKFQLTQCSSGLPATALSPCHSDFSVELVWIPYPQLAQLNALQLLLRECSDLVRQLVLKSARTSTAIITDAHPPATSDLNESQRMAAHAAVCQQVTMIQGPPGTGKSLVAGHIAKQLLQQSRMASQSPRVAIVYCACSNKAVDIGVYAMLRCMKDERQVSVLRVCSTEVEHHDWPLPPSVTSCPQLPPAPDDEVANARYTLPKDLRPWSLHWRVHDPEMSASNPYSTKVRDLYNSIWEAQCNEERSKLLKAYHAQLGEAKMWEIQQASIVLMTCVTAARQSLRRAVEKSEFVPTDLIVDEAGMVMEPEMLCPLTLSAWRRIILIGDHRQLQPVVLNHHAADLGYNISFFERLARAQDSGACNIPMHLLRQQYRMHPQISRFPSRFFYEGQLQDDESVAHRSVKPILQVRYRNIVKRMSMLAVQNEFLEEANAVSQNASKVGVLSKRNPNEAKLSIWWAQRFLRDAPEGHRSVAILTHYTAQVAEVKQQAQSLGVQDVHVGSIVTAQGSEWDSVILSLVRSSPQQYGAVSQNTVKSLLGDVADLHRMCVALTRSRLHLVVLGNFKTLEISQAWHQWLNQVISTQALMHESDMAGLDRSLFEVGDPVTFVQLQAEHLNGQQGMIHSFNDEKGRFEVTMCDGTSKFLKPCNLDSSCVLANDGATIVIHGLRENSAVNGQKGSVQTYDPLRKLFKIRLHSPVHINGALTEFVELRCKNLQVSEKVQALHDNTPTPNHRALVADCIPHVRQRVRLSLQPCVIGFSHSSCSSRFRPARSALNGLANEGPHILETLADIIRGSLNAKDLPALRVKWHMGRWYTLGNRRLAMYRLWAMHCQHASPNSRPLEVGDYVQLMGAGFHGVQGNHGRLQHYQIERNLWEVSIQGPPDMTSSEALLVLAPPQKLCHCSCTANARQPMIDVEVASEEEAHDWGWDAKFTTNNAGDSVELRPDGWRVGHTVHDSSPELLTRVFSICDGDNAK